MRILKAGLLYFALVFGAGFALGVVRTLWVAPRVGARAAELMESPLMLAVTYFTARRVVRRLALAETRERLGAGFLALGLLLAAEFALMLPLRGLSIAEYFATLDPVSGTVYYALLAAFALMPWLVAHGGSR